MEELDNLYCLNLVKLNGLARKSNSAYKNYSCRCDNCVKWSRLYDKYRLETNEIRRKQVKNSIKKWSDKNVERKRETKTLWRSNNREIHLEQDRQQKRRRRAKQRNNGFEKYTEKQVLELYGNFCHICNKEIDFFAPRTAAKSGWEYGLQIDHVVPISKGGPDILANVRPAHGICNNKKSAA